MPTISNFVLHSLHKFVLYYFTFPHNYGLILRVKINGISVYDNPSTGFKRLKRGEVKEKAKTGEGGR